MLKNQLLGLLVVLVAQNAVNAANKLLIEPQTLTVGDKNVAIPIKLDNDQNLYGFSLSLSTDITKLKIVGLDLVGSAAADAGWSFGQVLQSGGRVSWGVVLDVTEPFDVNKVIGPGQKIQIANLRVDVIAAAAGPATVSFQDFAGEPVARNLLVVSQGQTVAFTTQAGAITIQTAPVGKLFRRGDSDASGTLDLTDAIRILGFLFLGSGELGCLESADADDNGKIELTDAVRVLNYLFQGGTAPPSPGPPPGPCGIDPVSSGADIGCDSYSSC